MLPSLKLKDEDQLLIAASCNSNSFQTSTGSSFYTKASAGSSFVRSSSEGSSFVRSSSEGSSGEGSYYRGSSLNPSMLLKQEFDGEEERIASSEEYEYLEGGEEGDMMYEEDGGPVYPEGELLKENEGVIKKKRKPVNLNIRCPVCGGLAPDHLHFGGQCCYSCRAFFRRTSQRPISSFRCRGGKNDCVVTSGSKSCIPCRLRKCLKVGMDPTLVRGKKSEKGAEEGDDDLELPLPPLAPLGEMNGSTWLQFKAEMMKYQGLKLQYQAKLLSKQAKLISKDQTDSNTILEVENMKQGLQIGGYRHQTDTNLDFSQEDFADFPALGLIPREDQFTRRRDESTRQGIVSLERRCEELDFVDRSSISQELNHTPGSSPGSYLVKYSSAPVLYPVDQTRLIFSSAANQPIPSSNILSSSSIHPYPSSYSHSTFSSASSHPVFLSSSSYPLYSSTSNQSTFTSSNTTRCERPLEHCRSVPRKQNNSAAIEKYNNSAAIEKYNNSAAIEKYNNSAAIEKYNNSAAIEKYKYSSPIDSYKYSPLMERCRYSPPEERSRYSPHEERCKYSPPQERYVPPKSSLVVNYSQGSPVVSSDYEPLDLSVERGSTMRLTAGQNYGMDQAVHTQMTGMPRIFFRHSDQEK